VKYRNSLLQARERVSRCPEASMIHAVSCRHLGTERTKASHRSASVDLGLDVFPFPDGTTWSLPAAWGVKDHMNDVRKSFHTAAYVSLGHGDRWECKEEGRLVFHVPDGFMIDSIGLKQLQKPERVPSHKGWFVEKDRLFSCMNAMVEGKPLPPIRVATQSGLIHVLNGFHRYYASLLLKYKEIPVLREKIKVPASMNTTVSEQDGLLIEITDEDGATCFCEVVGMDRKQSFSQPRKERPHPMEAQTHRKTAWEPSARRREREERERREQIKKQAEKTLRQMITFQKPRQLKASYLDAACSSIHRTTRRSTACSRTRLS